MALVSIAEASKSFLASNTFKSVESKSSHGSKLLGDIWTYLLEVDANATLTGLILEAFEGQGRSAGSGYEWGVCLAAFIVKRVVEHNTHVAYVLHALNEGLGACQDVLSYSSFSIDEMASLINVHDMQDYIHAVEGHLTSNAREALKETQGKAPDEEDDGFEWFFEPQGLTKKERIESSFISQHIASAAMALDRDRIEMRIAAAVVSTFACSSQDDNCLEKVKIIRLLGKPLLASKVMVGSFIQLDASNQAMMDQATPLMEAIEGSKTLLMIEGDLLLLTHEVSATGWASGVDVILCSGQASSETRIANIRVISDLGVSAVRNMARACGVRTLPSAPGPYTPSNSALKHYLATVRLSVVQGILMDDSLNNTESIFLLIEPEIIKKSGKSSTVVILNSFTGAQAEASEVSLKRCVRDLESCCASRQKVLSPGCGLVEIMFSYRLRAMSKLHEIHMDLPDKLEDNSFQWHHFNAIESEDQRMLQTIIFQSMADAFEDMACAIFQSLSSHLPLGDNSTRDDHSLSALQEGIHILSLKAEQSLNAADLHDIQLAMSRKGGLDWNGILMNSLSSKQAGIRSAGLIAATVLQS